jgi:HEPN domain-containing protein
MNTSLSHLSPARRGQIQAITQRIVVLVRPEKIILFGAFASDSGFPDMGDEGAPWPSLAGYDILIIPRPCDKRRDFEIQDLVENTCRSLAAVNIIVHDMPYANRQIATGQYFFSMLLRDGVLLYDAGRVPLAQAAEPDWAAIHALARQDFDATHGRAIAFYHGARFCQGQGHHRIALFLFHQAAEQTYNGVLLAFNGYKPCTHNLDKLRRLTMRLSVELALLFPRHTDEEDRLFKLLLDSYTAARYKADFIISPADLETLAARVESLLSIAQRICTNRINSLRKRVKNAA